MKWGDIGKGLILCFEDLRDKYWGPPLSLDVSYGFTCDAKSASYEESFLHLILIMVVTE